MSEIPAARPRKWIIALIATGTFLVGFGIGVVLFAAGTAHMFNVACPAPFRPEPGDHINIVKGFDVTPPKPLSRPLTFPRAGAMARVQGAVVMLIYINATGHVEQAHVLRSSGFCPFDVEATKDLPNWRYAPAIQMGTAVGTWWIVNVNFNRAGSQPSGPPVPAAVPTRGA